MKRVQLRGVTGLNEGELCPSPAWRGALIWQPGKFLRVFLQIANKMVLGKWPYLDPDKAEGKGRKVKIRRGARKGKS